MISGPQYLDLVAPAIRVLSSRYGGWAFHSCGDWSAKIETIKTIPGLRRVDTAFSAATDPSPTDPEFFGQAFAKTGITLNARIVGAADVVLETVKRLWTRGLTLIVVTYCRDPDEQGRVYDGIHEACI